MHLKLLTDHLCAKVKDFELIKKNALENSNGNYKIPFSMNNTSPNNYAKLTIKRINQREYDEVPEIYIN